MNPIKKAKEEIEAYEANGIYRNLANTVFHKLDIMTVMIPVFGISFGIANFILFWHLKKQTLISLQNLISSVDPRNRILHIPNPQKPGLKQNQVGNIQELNRPMNKDSLVLF